MGRLPDHLSITTGVPQIAADLSRLPERARGALSSWGVPAAGSPQQLAPSAVYSGKHSAAVLALETRSTTLVRDRFATATTGRMRDRSRAPRLPQRFTEHTGQFLCYFKAAPGMRRHLDEAVRQLRVMHVSDVIACHSELLCLGVTDITKYVKAASHKDRFGKPSMAWRVHGRDI